MYILLSAGIPLFSRHADPSTTINIIAIREALKALVETVLDDATIALFDHPAITPLIDRLLRDAPRVIRRRIELYESVFEPEGFMERSKAFSNQPYPLIGAAARRPNIMDLRRRMIGSHRFHAGVFLGGDEGVATEFAMFVEEHDRAIQIPVPSTGGMAKTLWQNSGELARMGDQLCYQALFRGAIDKMRGLELDYEGPKM